MTLKPPHAPVNNRYPTAALTFRRRGCNDRSVLGGIPGRQPSSDTACGRPAIAPFPLLRRSARLCPLRAGRRRRGRCRGRVCRPPPEILESVSLATVGLDQRLKENPSNCPRCLLVASPVARIRFRYSGHVRYARPQGAGQVGVLSALLLRPLRGGLVSVPNARSDSFKKDPVDLPPRVLASVDGGPPAACQRGRSRPRSQAAPPAGPGRWWTP